MQTTSDNDGPVLFDLQVFEDERGIFAESYNERVLDDLLGREVRFVQDNLSRSKKGVLRGLHYQLPPSAQGKLVMAVRGEIFDVAVDVRAASPTFGDWVAFSLSGERIEQLWIPEGWAHGFLALTDVEVHYKTTSFYDIGCEATLRWDDPQLGINWPLEDGPPILSDKDRHAPDLPNARHFD